MSEGVRLEWCDNCGAVRVFYGHPSGWRCGGCRVCTTDFQAPLAAFGESL